MPNESIPEPRITRKELGPSGIYRTDKIDESPEEVQNALNMEGEVALNGVYMDRPVYIKILATSDGLEVTALIASLATFYGNLIYVGS